MLVGDIHRHSIGKFYRASDAWTATAAVECYRPILGSWRIPTTSGKLLSYQRDRKGAS